MQPTFSIVMPLYNHANLVDNAIQSVIAQTDEDWELIICNDGSTDESLERAHSHKDRRIRIIDKSLNSGGPSALNSALFISRARYICWLSSDDYYHPRKLAAHRRHLETNPGLTISIGPFAFASGTQTARATQFVPETNQRCTAFLYGNYINGLSLCIERSEFSRSGMFSEKYPHCADMHRWLCLFRNTNPLFFDDEPLSITRLSTSSQPDTEHGTSFEPARMLLNELVRHGLRAFVPRELYNRNNFDSFLYSDGLKDVLEAILDERNIMYRWGLGLEVEKIIANRLIDARVSTETIKLAINKESHENESPQARVLGYLQRGDHIITTPIAEYAIHISKNYDSTKFGGFFRRYLESTLS